MSAGISPWSPQTADPWQVAADLLDPPDVEIGPDHEEARRLAGSLRAYVDAAWPLIEPGRVLVGNWHIDAICDRLEAVTRGEIRRLAVNIPPRGMKSLLVSVFWPTWEWLSRPELRWLFASYAQPLATRDAAKSRRLMQTRGRRLTYRDTPGELSLMERVGYQGLLRLLADLEPGGEPWTFSDDQNLKMRYENDRTGYRLSTSWHGQVTGDGGDRRVIDDPHKPDEVASDVVRQSDIDWYDQVWASRGMNPETDTEVLIMQRLHEEDLTGHVLDHGGWEHICLPARYEPQHPFVWPDDPRTDAGELLWPDRMGDGFLRVKHTELGSYGFCTPGETPILMGDWTERPISEIRPGDEVVGFERGTPAKRAKLKPATVVAVTCREAEVVRLTMESGRTVRCTANHRWYTGRAPSLAEPRRKTYDVPKVGRRLKLVEEPLPEATPRERELWAYLAGIIDGEGTINARTVLISQSPEANPEVFRRIGEVLDELGVSYRTWEAEVEAANHSRCGQYTIHDAPYVCRCLLRYAPPAKAVKMRALLYARGHKFVRENDRVVEIVPDGVEQVYALTTTTGNYVAWGYASSNSGQYQQRPSPEDGGILKRGWWRYYEPYQWPKLPDGKPHLQEVAGSLDAAFKDTDGSDYVVLQLWGRDLANKYLLAEIRAKIEFTATVHALLAMDAWAAEHLGQVNFRWFVEDKANGSAVISSLRNRRPGMIAVDPEGGKEARARAAAPQVEAGNVWLPRGSIPCPAVPDDQETGGPFVDSQGRPLWEPVRTDVLVDECANFPNAANDDQGDAFSQALIEMDRRQGKRRVRAGGYDEGRLADR